MYYSLHLAHYNENDPLLDYGYNVWFKQKRMMNDIGTTSLKYTSYFFHLETRNWR